MRGLGDRALFDQRVAVSGRGVTGLFEQFPGLFQISRAAASRESEVTSSVEPTKSVKSTVTFSVVFTLLPTGFPCEG